MVQFGNLKPGEFWGKWDEEAKAPTFLSLRDHSCDVAAVTEALLVTRDGANTLLAKRLARLGGQDELTLPQVHALCFFAFMHDFGKASIPFQLIPFRSRKSRLYDESIKGPCPDADWGHVKPALNIFARSDWAVCLRILELLFQPAGLSANDLFRILASSLCHHGTPFRPGSRLHKESWQEWNGLDPIAAIEDLVKGATKAFPLCREPDSRPPLTAPFLHGWNGLLTLADWIGSAKTFFPFRKSDTEDRMKLARKRAQRALKAVGLDVSKARASLATAPEFGHIAEFPQPRAAQAAVGGLELSPDGSTVILEAATGSGKTEAALWHFARLFHAGLVDGFYFALPTRSAAVQIHRRIFKMIRRLFPDVPKEDLPAVILAVPGYLRADDAEGTLVSRFEVEWSDALEEGQAVGKLRAWAAERSKRYTAGAFVIGTVDQILMSVLRVKHAHLRQAPLLRHLLIVDEVHASDTYMTTILQQVLFCHRAAQGHAFLMSATLGSKARHMLMNPGPTPTPFRQPLVETLASPYPGLFVQTGTGGIQTLAVEDASPAKEVTLDPRGLGLMEEPARIAALALEEARKGAKVLVIRNTVKACQATQKELERLAEEKGCRDLLFSVNVGDRAVPAPHHSRFGTKSRRALDRSIERFFNPDPNQRLRTGCVAVTTQTVEQSLDIDADLMITDLCPMDTLLQRLGRLFRHATLWRPAGFETARVLVLTPNRELADYLGKKGNAFGVNGLGGLVYSDLRVLQATRQELEARTTLRLPTECRELVERTTHPDILSSIGSDNPDLEEHWKAHANKILGLDLQKGNIARNSLMPWDELFGEFELDHHLGHHIQTRLGAADILVKLPGEPIGPFGFPVTELTIRPYELDIDLASLPDNPVAEAINALEGTICFKFGKKDFVYDRLGLREHRA